MAQLKCYGDECIKTGKKWDREKLEVFNGKRYCENCLKIKKIDFETYQPLIFTIKKYFGIPYPTGIMLRQVKDFRFKRGYSYLDITNAILYINFVLRKPLITKYGLGLVPYIIEDSKKYYILQNESNKKMQEQTVDNSVLGVVVKVNKTHFNDVEKVKSDFVKKQMSRFDDLDEIEKELQ